jgi:ribosomal protein S18 acetylase RimI-like enzyme
MIQFKVRPITAGDATGVGKLAEEFAKYLRDLGDKSELNFNAAIFLRDGFGDAPAFSGLVAENADEILGYLLYHSGYDTDCATRTLQIIDLYVSKNWRGQGIGKALMEETGSICRHQGGSKLFWSVFAPNKLAIMFYESLGATFTQDLLFMKLDV